MTGVIKDSWCDLPTDVLNAISERLLYVEQIHFRSVCKSWRSNTNPLKHAADKLPWVMSFKEIYHVYRFDIGVTGSNGLSGVVNSSLFYLYDPSQKRKYTLQNEILNGANVHASKHGWLLLSKKKYAGKRMPSSFFIFYTPFNHKIIQLPELHKTNGYSKATFSTAPTSPDCLIFVLTAYDKKHYVSTCRLGDKRWRTVSFDGEYGKIDSVAFVGGVFYCLFSYKHMMASFKVDQKEWKIHSHPWTRNGNLVVDQHLVESHDGNLLVSCLYLDHSQKIFRYDQLDMKWFNIENLGNTLLFLGVTSMLLPAIEEASELASTIHEAGHRLNSFIFGIRFSDCGTPRIPLWQQTYEDSKRTKIHDRNGNEDWKKIWIQPLKQT
ncbi:hypothetical protein ACOSP7_008719 [Xanthoceras sorbifolium]